MRNFLYKALTTKATILMAVTASFADGTVPVETLTLNYEKIVFLSSRSIIGILISLL